MSGAEKARNVYGRNLIARELDGEKAIYRYNGHGDVIALNAPNGDMIAEYAYDEFGQVIEEQAAPQATPMVDIDFSVEGSEEYDFPEDSIFDNPYRYAGYEYLDEVELYDLNARYYDPSIARFLTEDPYYNLGNRVMGVYEINVPNVYSIMQANALYAYCGNNPISFIDLTGKWQEGDENLPDWAQDAIIEYTYNYNMSRSDEGREYFHQKAEMVRDFVENNYVSREEWNADDEKNDQWVEDPDKDVIVIHHTANNDTVQEIEQEHIEKFDGIGYHFVIGKDGTVYEGRTFDKKGSHVANANTGKIGIALIGDYYDGKWWEVWEWGADELPDSQKESLYVLVEILKDGQGIHEIGGHRDYKNGTVCPGNELYGVVEDLK